jgi:hypothetical protein
MHWIKKGLLFTIHKQTPLRHSHASVPFVESIDAQTLRILFSSRDQQGRSRPFAGFLKVSDSGELELSRIEEQPILELGKLGTFDDNGIMPFWVVEQKQQRFLYYIGWNPAVTVPYRIAIGLAISKDGGRSYERLFEGPILDRSLQEPYFVSTPCVMYQDGIWKMWYLSCSSWEVIGNRPEPRYRIKYAESHDGVRWSLTGCVCIDYDSETEAITRPCVRYENNRYRMWYSYRRVDGYRTDPTKSYRLGYAESNDGITWTRKDSSVGITRSETGWDSEMICYSHVVDHGGRRYLFYNGNGFGQSGIGYAILDQE